MKLTKQEREMSFKEWFPKFLRCVFLWRHERVSFYSHLYKDNYHMCRICGWWIGVGDKNK